MLIAALHLVVGHLPLAASSGDTLATTLRNWIAPLFLLAIGFAAMSFLFQRQVTKFLEFAALAVGVALFFYYPGVIQKVAAVFSKAFG